MDQVPVDILIKEICGKLDRDDLVNLRKSGLIDNIKFWKELTKANHGEFFPEFRGNRSWKSFYLNILPPFSSYFVVQEDDTSMIAGPPLIDLVKHKLTKSASRHEHGVIKGYLLANLVFEGRSWEEAVLRMDEYYAVIKFVVNTVIDDRVRLISSICQPMFLNDMIKSIRKILFFRRGHPYGITVYDLVKLP